MALTHDFYILPRENFSVDEELVGYFLSHPQQARKYQYPQGELTTRAHKLDDSLIRFFVQHRAQGVSIHDDFILPDLRKFEAVTTLHNGCIPLPGLNYYAMSVIVPQDLPRFIEILETIPNSAETIALCRKALADGCYVLHCGI